MAEVSGCASRDPSRTCRSFRPRPAHGVIDLRDPVQRAGEQVRRRALEKCIDFALTMPDGPAAAVGDPAMLSRLFHILMDNAVKYTHEGGRVCVSLQRREEETVLLVEDSGIGIADEELALIFERFYRSDKARQRDTGGAGLGLSIASWIAEMHHARIAVASRIGVGSTFSVTLARSA